LIIAQEFYYREMVGFQIGLPSALRKAGDLIS
jgi:hypothetical protein